MQALNMSEAPSPAILREYWSGLRLAAEPESKSSIPVLKISSLAGPPAWASILMDGRPALLIETKPSSETPRTDIAANIRFSERKLVHDGRHLNVLQLECQNHTLEAIFAEVCAMVLDRTARGVLVHAAVLAVLQELKELLGTGPVPPKQSSDTTIGVLGELLVLHALVSHHPENYHAWIGPTGSRFDFRSGTFLLEVKTLTKKQTETVSISSLDQLEAPSKGQLWMYVITLEPDPHGMLSVPELQNSIRQLLHKDDISSFDKNMNASIGKTPVEASPADRYSLYSTNLYRIAANFPALTRHNLIGTNLPAGVSHVRYRLDLSVAAAWKSDLNLEELLQQKLVT